MANNPLRLRKTHRLSRQWVKPSLEQSSWLRVIAEIHTMTAGCSQVNCSETITINKGDMAGFHFIPMTKHEMMGVTMQNNLTWYPTGN